MDTKRPFEEIVAAHAATVLRVCRAVVGFDDAEDAWSETFLAALNAYPQLPADANVEAWLVTIAHRKAIDITRARRRMSTAEVPERASPIGNPGEDNMLVWDAVKRLPDKQRKAIAYHYVAGLPFKDIAQILGGTTDAARRAASDGMKTLRALMKGESR